MLTIATISEYYSKKVLENKKTTIRVGRVGLNIFNVEYKNYPSFDLLNTFYLMYNYLYLLIMLNLIILYIYHLWN